jgi:hypothetical protein
MPAITSSRPIRRNDRHDIDHVEAKLVSIGHHLVRFARLKGLNANERTIFWEAAQIVLDAKREYRTELRVRRAQRAEVIAVRFSPLTKVAEARKA